MLRGYDRYSEVNKIFELPFLFASQSHLEKSQNKQCRLFGRFVRQATKQKKNIGSFVMAQRYKEILGRLSKTMGTKWVMAVAVLSRETYKSKRRVASMLWKYKTRTGHRGKILSSS
ncbi:hypothetical protein F7725_019495 [Dissostichus mawsoni]|uniref:Uncharacterized protein n=1 Tax=Dissostichus mawsoni TaxID=36200 RepID=A0A7J5YJV1_DISMA|nr:hypothetical protein F7725_019495 [Dissostichus mawsoni]